MSKCSIRKLERELARSLALPIRNPATLHRFPDLPTELQVQIFSYAAIPSTSIILHKAVFTRAIKAWLPEQRPRKEVMELYDCFWRYQGGSLTNPVKYGPRDPYVLDVVPESLLGTCRLSRLMGLERWKKEVEKIPLLENVQGAEEMVGRFKESVVRGLDREIRKLKGGG